MRYLQNRLWMLWRRRNLQSSSAISDIYGWSGYRSSRRLFSGYSWSLPYQTPPSDDFIQPGGGPSVGGYPAELCAGWTNLRGVYSPRPPLIDPMIPEAEKAVMSVSPSVVKILFHQGNRLLGEGAGTIIDPDGTILTTAHLMGSPKSAEALQEIAATVILDEGDRSVSSIFEAAVSTADFFYDVAIIKIAPDHPLQTAKLGTLHEVSLDDVVLSLGRCGISLHDVYPQFVARKGKFIRGLSREGVTFYHGGLNGELISVTCPNEPGCDGGPLVNCRGDVIGVMSSRTGNYSYAISIDVVKNILEHFKQYGRVIRPFIGVSIAELNERSKPQVKGGDITPSDVREDVTLFAVTPGSPADRAGLLPDDNIIEFDGKYVRNFHEFIEIMWNKIGRPLKMVVKRSDDISVILTVVPDEAGPETYDRWLPTRLPLRMAY